MIQRVELVHLPPELGIFVAVYQGVENAAFLREQLLAGNSDFEYAFIDASMVSRWISTIAPSSEWLTHLCCDRSFR
jgi:hypothetical protein